MGDSHLEKLKAELTGIVGAQGVLSDEPMSAHTSFRIGGPADCFVMPAGVDELAAVLDAVRGAGVPLYVMGRGSNLLVADAGLRGVVVQLAGNFAGVSIGEDGTAQVDAGASNARVAALACREGWSGYEFAAGIPGTVGGAAIMNAGAYDGEFRHVATGVTCLDCQGALVELSASEANWGYRSSALADAGLVVVSARLAFREGDPASIQARMDELARRRLEKQPLDKPSAGSTFKRPVGHFAGKLIQDAGMQGYSVGRAQVSEKHAGFVVNLGGATAADVAAVIRDVQDRVADAFGVALEPEVRMWGFEA